MPERPCIAPGCRFHAAKGRRYCGWHLLDRLSIEEQELSAQHRLGLAPEPHRVRVKTAEGSQWCSGCQTVVPDFYTSGSRCKACARRARRASHVERTYGIAGADEVALQTWQGHRCFICGRRAVTRQLAVDHDHESGAVRGLLCSDSEHGCNVLLRRILGDPEAARRLLAYVERWPLERMRAGEPPWQWPVVAHPVRDDGDPPF